MVKTHPGSFPLFLFCFLLFWWSNYFLTSITSSLLVTQRETNCLGSSFDRHKKKKKKIEPIGIRGLSSKSCHSMECNLLKTSQFKLRYFSFHSTLLPILPENTSIAMVFCKNRSYWPGEEASHCHSLNLPYFWK